MQICINSEIDVNSEDAMCIKKKKVLNHLLTNLLGLVVTFYVDYYGTYLQNYVTISKFSSTGIEYSGSETSFCIV